MAENAQKTERKRGRPRWEPPNLEMVKALAMQGLTMENIARTLGISPSTLYAKKQQYLEFSEAIKNGQAEGEAIATSELFKKVKKGDAWAVCFFLKSRYGWKDWADPNQVNINVNGNGVPAEVKERERVDEMRKLFALLTDDEQQIYVDLLRVARQRQDAQKAAARAAQQPATIETTAERVEPEGNV